MESKLLKSVNYWYIPLILGILFIGLGVWVFATPLASYVTLAFIFSVSFLVSGLLETYYALSNRKTLDNWGWFLVGGIVNLLFGLLLVTRIEISMLILSFYVGFWLLFRSIMTISTSFDLKKHEGANWGYLLTLGILGTIFAFILLWNPLFAGLTVVYWTALGFLLFGIFNIWFSIQIRKVKKHKDKFIDKLDDLLDD